MFLANVLSGCATASTPILPTLFPPAATPTVFAIFDPEYIYLDPSLGETPYANKSILIAQPDELKGGSIIAVLGNDGKPA